MKPIAPMLAVPMSKADITDWSLYVAEEKYDGWRLIVTLPAHDPITAHTRERKHAGSTGKDQNDVTDMLPVSLLQDLDRLRPRTGWVVLDGELLAIHPNGRVGTSTDVPRKELAKRYVVFDVLMTQQGSSMMLPYAQRRDILATMFNLRPGGHDVMLAEVRPCVDTETVSAFTHEVWNRGGEGLILKLKSARYESGKRRAAFVKIKKLYTAVIKITGFEPSRGTVRFPGHPFATVVGDIVEAPPEHASLIGRQTSVKTKDDDSLATFEHEFRKAHGALFGAGTWPSDAGKMHPALGRLLRIEYQDVAAEGGVRHPRWDRWEKE